MSETTSPRQAAQGVPAPGFSMFDPRELVGMVLKHRWIILGVTAAVGLATTFVTLRQTKVYSASCTIEYDPKPPRPLGADIEDFADPVGSYWASREFFATQNRVLQSHAIAERVVRRLGLHEPGAGYFRLPASKVGRADADEIVRLAAEKVLARLSVEQERDSRIVHIMVRDENPSRARDIANAIADAYIEKTSDDRLGATRNALEWLRSQNDDLRTKLDTSELALHEFKRDNNILSVSMEDRQNLVAAEIQHFNQALTETRTRRIALQARIDQLRRIDIRAVSPSLATLLSERSQAGQLRERYEQKLAELRALERRVGPNWPARRELEAEVATLEEQLRSEMAAIVESAERELREVRATESGLRAALESANVQGLELNLREIEFSRLSRERVNNEKLYSVVLQRTAETNLTNLLRVAFARVVDQAVAPEVPVSPKLTVNITAGVLGGLFLGFAVAFLVSRMDRTIRHAEDVEALGLPVLGIVPTIDRADEGKRTVYGRRRPQPGRTPITNKDLIVHTHPRSSPAECCRTIRTNLAFMSAGDPLRALVITSAGPREGKTTVATSLAIAIAQSGKRTLLIDTDLRKPRIHRSFGVSGQTGITSLLVADHFRRGGESDGAPRASRPGDSALGLTDVCQETGVPNLWLMPCGPIPPNPSELLHAARFREVMDEALAQFDRVIFDSPPLGAVTDAAIMAPQVGGVLVVVQAQKTTRDATASAVRQLRDVKAHIVGSVLNDVDLTRRQYGYGYGSYYYYRYQHEGYYYGSGEDAPGGGPSDGDAGGPGRPVTQAAGTSSS